MLLILFPHLRYWQLCLTSILPTYYDWIIIIFNLQNGPTETNAALEFAVNTLEVSGFQHTYIFIYKILCFGKMQNFVFLRPHIMLLQTCKQCIWKALVLRMISWFSCIILKGLHNLLALCVIPLCTYIWMREVIVATCRLKIYLSLAIVIVQEFKCLWVCKMMRTPGLIAKKSFPFSCW